MDLLKDIYFKARKLGFRRSVLIVFKLVILVWIMKLLFKLFIQLIRFFKAVVGILKFIFQVIIKFFRTLFFLRVREQKDETVRDTRSSQNILKIFWYEDL